VYPYFSCDGARAVPEYANRWHSRAVVDDTKLVVEVLKDSTANILKFKQVLYIKGESFIVTADIVNKYVRSGKILN